MDRSKLEQVSRIDTIECWLAVDFKDTNNRHTTFAQNQQGNSANFATESIFESNASNDCTCSGLININKSAHYTIFLHLTFKIT